MVDRGQATDGAGQSEWRSESRSQGHLWFWESDVMLIGPKGYKGLVLFISSGRQFGSESGTKWTEPPVFGSTRLLLL